MESKVGIEKWGTWEELLLGGAVLRHGTRDWDVVAAELRSRAVCPYTFTPEVCKAKYENLQHRYSGCTAWFEELRKQRMAELRRALEQSEDSIGSLELKLVSLKAEKKDGQQQAEYDSSRTESPIQFQKSEGLDYTSKDSSKDMLSASSFTQQTQTNYSSEYQKAVASPAEEISPSEKEKGVLSIKLEENIRVGQVVSIRKRRGKRKRKDCSRDAKEVSVGESNFLSSVDIVSVSRCKENSTSNSDQIARSFDANDQCRSSSKDVIDDLLGIYSSIAKNECASVFRRRLDSQKRGRYKKLVLQHIDFDTIKSRISNHSISSAKELFRDLLLLTNNAMVFYSKSTREHKSAALLRDIVTKTYRQYLRDLSTKATVCTTLSSSSPMRKPPAKPRSIRHGKRKPPGKIATYGNIDITSTPHGCGNPLNADSPPSVESLAMTKKSCALPKKGVRGRSTQRCETPVKGKKRSKGR